MKMDKDLIARLTALARIELSPDSESRITSQLETIISYVARLAQADTSGIRPANQTPRQNQGTMRADRTEPGLSHESTLAQAPDALLDFFRVPKVIDREEDR